MPVRAGPPGRTRPRPRRRHAAQPRHGRVYLTSAQLLRANVLFLRGLWDDGMAEIRAALDNPDPLRQAPALRGFAAMVAIHRGQARTLDQELAMLAADSPLEAPFTAPLRWAHALAEENENGPAAALDVLFPLWEQPPTFSPRCIGYRVCADLARLAHAAGDTGRLRVLAETTADLLTRQPIDSVEGTAAFCGGLLHEDPSRLLAAAAWFAQAGWPMHEGYAREHAAVLLAAAAAPAGPGRAGRRGGAVHRPGGDARHRPGAPAPARRASGRVYAARAAARSTAGPR
ncbi:hypothetical protein ACFQZ4_01795 [Catellatospora coxensis]